MSEEQGNVLSQSNNPYLIQHSDNPVHWKMWDNASFQMAKRLQKPLFISIGYSTCHWCHVMARESFEDREVAELLNRMFISIKVDREERPDIDNFYMDIALKMNGSGGWPLTVIATPEGKPFFTATYIPKNGVPGRAGLMELLPEIDRLWRTEKQKVLNSADSIIEAVLESNSRAKTQQIDLSSETEYDIPSIQDVLASLKNSFDPQAGGFGTAPKFPQAHLLDFLIQYGGSMESSNQAARMVMKSLNRMRAGGIYDHIGFGFHRYATDRFWKVPHFEKMLYDQAQLALLYTDAYAATLQPEYEQTVREIFHFCKNELLTEEGAFFSALNAESEGKEGWFYLWGYTEMDSLLSKSEKELLRSFNVHPDGNWIDPVTREAESTNILQAPSISTAIAPVPNWEQVRQKLYDYRVQKPLPDKDDKIITSWNAQMARAFARAGRVLNDSTFIADSEKVVEFLLSKMRKKDGTLMHVYRQGSVKVDGQIEDYGFLISALIELYSSTFRIEYLNTALELMQLTLDMFEDTRSGGFFTAAGCSEIGPKTDPASRSGHVALNFKALYDGAIPSSTSIVVENLELLFRLTGELEYRNAVLRTLSAHKSEISATPTACSLIIGSVYRLLSGKSREIVVVGEGEEAEAMLELLRTGPYPKAVIHHKTSGNAEALADAAGFTNTLTSNSTSGAAAYVCSGFSCERPVTTAQDLQKLISQI